MAARTQLRWANNLPNLNNAVTTELERALDPDGVIRTSDVLNLDNELNIVALNKVLEEKLKLTYDPAEGFNNIRDKFGEIANDLKRDYDTVLADFINDPIYSKMTQTSMLNAANKYAKMLANFRISLLKTVYPMHMKTLMGDLGALTESADIPKDAYGRPPATTLTKKIPKVVNSSKVLKSERKRSRKEEY